MSSPLQTGDRVLALQAVAKSSGMFTGAVTAPIAAGMSGWWSGSLLAGIVAAIAGQLLGGIVGGLMFPAPPGQTTIVKVGRRALGIALRASVAGGLPITAASASAALVLGGGMPAIITGLVGIGVSIVVGCLGALT